VGAQVDADEERAYIIQQVADLQVRAGVSRLHPASSGRHAHPHACQVLCMPLLLSCSALDLCGERRMRC